MNLKKIHTLIVVVFSIVFCYNLFWIFKSLTNLTRFSFQLRFFINYIPVLLGITGLIIFITSQYKRSNLLRIYMCLQIMSFPFVVYFYFRFLSNALGPFNRGMALSWTFYVGALLNLSLFTTCIIGLRALSFNKTANLTFIKYENERSAQFSPAPAGLRFANRLIDELVILYVLWINFYAFGDYFRYAFGISPGVYLLLEIPFLLFYYIVLEGIFNTTAGKCATDTTIVNLQGERPAFTQILGRAFCRLIPFEAFSFFGEGGRGWHDSLTNTYVTDSINREDFEMNEFTLDAELNNNTNESYYSAG